MQTRNCRRCNHTNRSDARYCVVCGCPRQEVSASSTAATPQQEQPKAGLAWLCVLVILVAARLDRTLSNAETNSRATHDRAGLVFDLPPDYPPGYFDGD
jgi:hypothetical protein